MTEPFPASDFDDWAETYDQAVPGWRAFPFTGYEEVLRTIYKLAEPRPGFTVLDLGTGTGNLAVPFVRAGCRLWCTDFSEHMLAKARQKLPGAHFVLHDLNSPMPPELDCLFDRVISAYVFHHFEPEKKVSIIKNLCAHSLPSDGYIIIGDIAFPDTTDRDKIRADLGEKWEEEFYWLVDESTFALNKIGVSVQYEQVSSCAGVFVIHPLVSKIS